MRNPIRRCLGKWPKRPPDRRPQKTIFIPTAFSGPAFDFLRNRDGGRKGLDRLVSAADTAGITVGVVHIARLLAGGPRADRDDEVKGLDSAIHGERAFEIEL